MTKRFLPHFILWPMVLALIFMVGMQENGQAVSYVKRFEKSAAVCTHGENFLKKDQSDREPWELDPRNLGGIVWEKKKAISEGLDMEAAAFDLDNNGDKEILVKLNSWGPHGYRKIESLTIIRGPDLSSFSLDDLRKDENVLATNGDTREPKSLRYDFSKLPKNLSRIPAVVHGVDWVNDYVYIAPFSFEGTSYLAVEDNGGGDFVVSRWRRGEKLEVVCYFTYVPKPAKKKR